jgi:hypothetical protein
LLDSASILSYFGASPSVAGFRIDFIIFWCVANQRSAARVPAKPLGEDGILNQNPIFEMDSMIL